MVVYVRKIFYPWFVRPSRLQFAQLGYGTVDSNLMAWKSPLLYPTGFAGRNTTQNVGVVCEGYHNKPKTFLVQSVIKHRDR